MFELTAFQRDLMFVTSGIQDSDEIEEELPNGLEIKAHMERYYEAPVNHGRLYPNLDTLVGEGLLEKTETDLRTNGYGVTEEGQRVIEERVAWEEEMAEATTTRMV